MKKLGKAAHLGVIIWQDSLIGRTNGAHECVRGRMPSINQGEKENGTGVCASKMRISVSFPTLMQPKKGKVRNFFEQAP